MSVYHYSFDHRGTWQRTVLTTLCIVLSVSSLGVITQLLPVQEGCLLATCCPYIYRHMHMPINKLI